MDDEQQVVDNFCDHWIFFPAGTEASDNHRDRRMKRCVDRIKELSAEYLWHRDPMEVAVDNGQSLRGRTYFGDCIEDEWQIVRILRQISIEQPDLLLRCVDNDGQFLLIEAANELPRWMMAPERMENRVFIRKGRLLIIPRSALPDDSPVLNNALEAVVEWLFANLIPDDSIFYAAVPSAVERALAGRLLMCDNSMAQQISVQCIVPRAIARLLMECPQWISAAVEAFYARDLPSLRVCAS